MARARKTGKEEFMIGVDLGGTKILAAVLNAAGGILARQKAHTLSGEGVAEVIGRIVHCIEGVIRDAGISKDRVIAIGVGSPGPLNPDTGVIESPVNLPGWDNIPLKTILEKRLKTRAHIENDVNAGTYGEFRMGAGVGIRDLVGIFIGTGIGGGLILDGKLYHGFNRNSGEIGHMVVGMDGPLCKCGRRGCYEAFAGRLSVIRRIQEISAAKKTPSLAVEYAGGDPSAVRSSHLARAWQAGDEAAHTALREMAEVSGVAIANLMNLLSPEMFVLGGGVIEALGKELLPIMEKAAFEQAFPVASRHVRIRPAMLGDDAGIIGAAFLARERALSAKNRVKT
jgi:glucokinase